MKQIPVCTKPHGLVAAHDGSSVYVSCTRDNVLKRIRMDETKFFELRAEFYNVFNHPQYGTASVSPFSPASTGVPANVFTSAAGQFLHPEFSDGGGRVIRYQLKFGF